MRKTHDYVLTLFKWQVNKYRKMLSEAAEKSTIEVHTVPVNNVVTAELLINVIGDDSELAAFAAWMQQLGAVRTPVRTY